MPFNPSSGQPTTEGGNQSIASQVIGQLGLTTDNPQYQAIVKQIQQIVSSSPGVTAQNIVQWANGQGGGQSGGQNNVLNPQLVSLTQQAQTWQTQNQGTSPAQRALNNQMTQTATTFANNIPQLEYTLTQQAAQAQKSTLASAMEATKDSYNAGGLLYGNAQQGAQAANVGTAATNVENEAAGINQNVQNESQTLNQAALTQQNALTAANQAAAANQTQLTGAYNSIAEQNQALQNSALSAIGQGIGGALGTGVAAATGGTNGNANGTSGAANGTGTGYPSLGANTNLGGIPTPSSTFTPGQLTAIYGTGGAASQGIGSNH